MNNEIENLVKKLELQKHPEGGYFKEIYRSEDTVPIEIFPDRNNSLKPYRNFCTSIYYLLVHEDVSVFHKIKSDEIWHFYQGSPILLHILNENTGEYLSKELGSKNQFQVIIPKNVWFAAEVKDKNLYSLVGCTVSPGFEFEDFTIAKREELLEKFPKYKELIKKFTK